MCLSFAQSRILCMTNKNYGDGHELLVGVWSFLLTCGKKKRVINDKVCWCWLVVCVGAGGVVVIEQPCKEIALTHIS